MRCVRRLLTARLKDPSSGALLRRVPVEVLNSNTLRVRIDPKNNSKGGMLGCVLTFTKSSRTAVFLARLEASIHRAWVRYAMQNAAIPLLPYVHATVFSMSGGTQP